MLTFQPIITMYITCGDKTSVTFGMEAKELLLEVRNREMEDW